jgi:hypothetical protein
LCYETQLAASSNLSANETPTLPASGKHRNITVVGLVTLAALDRLEAESQTGRGWIACACYYFFPLKFNKGKEMYSNTELNLGTKDAMLMKKPSYYDLIIDLTAATTHKSLRLMFYSSKSVAPVQSGSGGSNYGSYRLSIVQFTWSDVKLVCFYFFPLKTGHNLNTSIYHPALYYSGPKLTGSCASTHPTTHHRRSPHAHAAAAGRHRRRTQPQVQISLYLDGRTDGWQVYEDVCILCTALWMGNWRGSNSPCHIPPQAWRRTGAPSGWKETTI